MQLSGMRLSGLYCISMEWVS